MADIREQLLAAFEVEYREHVDSMRAAVAASRAGGAVDLREMFRRGHSLKGAARAVDLPVIETAAHTIETQLAAALDANRGLNADDIRQVTALLDDIEREAAAVYRRDERADNDVALAQAPSVAPSVEYVRVNAAQVQKLSESMHDLSTHLDLLDTGGDALHALQIRAQALAQMLARRGAPSAQEKASMSAEADAIARGIATSIRRQHEFARSSGDAAARVRDEIERVAMVPASTVFGGLEGMIRDVAADAGRDVEVKVEGLDVQADRQLLQALRDSVMHLLRNAVAHGIEPAMERLAAGKPAHGEVGLRLRTRAGRLEITVYDDGRGPDLRRIEEVAVARGLLPQRSGGSSPPSADRLLALTFEPGFSTSPQVDKVSGRGMGLSVVLEAVRRAGGGARMRRRMPFGTEITLSTPLSASRQPVLLVMDGGQAWGFPTHGLDRVVQVPLDELDQVDGQLSLRLGQEGNQSLAPVVSLARLLGRHEPHHQQQQQQEEPQLLNLLLLRQGDQQLALQVQSPALVRTAKVSALSHPDVEDLVQGAMQLEQDQVAVVLNPEALLRRYSRSEVLQKSPTPPSRPKRQHTVLVVDDSVTTRTLEQSVLQSHGYAVILAVDGIDALEKLRASPSPIDLVVADVEMPRMDGFQLLSALKADQQLSALPVIMMTSRADPDDIRRGLELGADAYLVKQTFDQKELLKTIGQLL